MRCRTSMLVYNYVELLAVRKIIRVTLESQMRFERKSFEDKNRDFVVQIENNNV